MELLPLLAYVKQAIVKAHCCGKIVTLLVYFSRLLIVVLELGVRYFGGCVSLTFFLIKLTIA